MEKTSYYSVEKGEKNILERYLERPGMNKKLWNYLYIILAVSVVFDLAVLLITHAHHHFAVEGIPAFYSIFGFIACTVLLIGSKWIGKFFHLMVPEDYYRKDYRDYFTAGDEKKDQQRVERIVDSVSDNRD